MTTPNEPPSRERRATDGLDWSPGGLRQPLEGFPEREPSGPSLPPPGQSAGSRFGPLAWSGIGAIVGGLIAGGTVALVVRDDDDAERNGSQESSPATTSITVTQDDAVIQVAAKARPSIVRIESSHRTLDGIVSDVGSGVVLDEEGHVLTNAHVVLNTETLKVFLSDGTERPAIVLGHDAPFTDVAVVQIGPGNLTPVEIGDSSALALGQTVVAIGNPLSEFEGSVTVGVISGLDRKRILDGVRQDDLIQTDAAVNNGNSGGALLNVRGQLVGVPTLVIRQTRNNQPVEGISFAIPSNRAMEIARAIIKNNSSYPRPAMGIEHVDITPDMAGRFTRLPVSQGAWVASVTPGGPADLAGIVTGDIITRVGDSPVDQDNPFLNGLMLHEPGDTVRVVLNRNGRIIEADVRLAKRS